MSYAKCIKEMMSKKKKMCDFFQVYSIISNMVTIRAFSVYDIKMVV